MRIVHTADWHLGKIWKNRSRMDESRRVLDHLARYVREEKCDLLLMAGDLFDTPNPGGEAEDLVLEFFHRLHEARVPAAVIAGNHDSPVRLDAWSRLTRLAGVHVVGQPKSATNGGVLEIPTRSGETAIVAALPFASPGVFLSALELQAGLGGAMSRYSAAFSGAVLHLASRFRPECVNLLMAHTQLDGAILSNSERQAHLGDDWAATPQAIPSTAQYVALGHIHKPQRVESAPAPTEYCGSPLQLDFGEAGQEKSFVVVDVKPGRPAQVNRVRVEGGTPLVDLRLTMAELTQRESELRQAGWLRLTLLLDQPDPNLARTVMDQFPQAVQVRLELPHAPETEVPRSREGRSPLDLYRQFHLERHSVSPELAVEDAFQDLYRTCEENPCVPSA